MWAFSKADFGEPWSDGLLSSLSLLELLSRLLEKQVKVCENKKLGKDQVMDLELDNKKYLLLSICW